SGDALAQSRIEVHEPSTILRLGDFTVTAERGAAAPTVPAQAVPLTVESGYFTFYQPSNVEITVKILDGRSLNGHYWVFLASITDQPVEVTVLQHKDECLTLPTDPKHVCPWRSYKAAAGKNQNFIDVVFPLETPSV